jgi:hypothetical protein
MRATPPEFDPHVRAALDEARGLIAARDVPAALALYQRTWDELVAGGDHFHACVIAHMAGVAEPDAAKKHEWNVAALREAEAVPDTMRWRGMFASLHNNLGMSHSLQGRPDEARRCFDLALTHLDEIDPGPYRDQVRAGIERNIARLL